MSKTEELLTQLQGTHGSEEAVVRGVLAGLQEQAEQGDQQAAGALYAVQFQDHLCKTIVALVRTMMQTSGIPPTAPTTIAAGLAGAIEEIGYRMPTLRAELNAIIQELDSDPEVRAKRVRNQAEFNARLDLAQRLRAEGCGTDYIRQKLRELQDAQLSDVMESQDRAEALHG